MPGPTTEVLNDDIKELKGELRDIRGDINVLKADVHRIDVGLAELRAEFRFAKWLVGLTLAATLTATISAIAGGAWWAATITAELKHLAATVESLKAAPRVEPPAKR